MPSNLGESKGSLDTVHDAGYGVNGVSGQGPEFIGTPVPWDRLIERYMNVEVGICLDLHMRFPSLDSERCNFVLVFQGATGGDIKTANTGTLGYAESRRRLGGPAIDNVEFPVTVAPRQIVQQPQVIVNDSIAWPKARSVVRLYGFDNGPSVMREWCDLPGGVLEVPRCGTDRKLQVLRIGGRVLSGIENGGAINTSIKSGAELVEHLAKEQTEDDRDVVLWGDPDSACPVVVYLHEGGIGLIFKKAIPEFGEFLSVRVCPIDTIPGVEKL